MEAFIVTTLVRAVITACTLGIILGAAILLGSALCSRLPRGALVRKMIGGRRYFYLAHREGKKVKFDYLGKLADEDVARHEEAKHSRARYRQRLSEVNKQIRFLRKVLRAKQAV